MSETPPQHTAAERAVTVLMAMVPCGADTARQILGDTAWAAGTGLRETAEAVLLLGSGGKPPAPLGRALADAMDEARSATEPVTPPYTRLLPDPQAIGELLKRHRALRRRALAAPHDPAVRDELDDATYTLCILMGQRNAYTALRSAELLLGTEWLGTTAAPTGVNKAPQGATFRSRAATFRDRQGK
ncbi:DUF5133 domain-containing protein [Streptomyces sp. NRRL S-244]|uniref:DUF5133 domain-containing protein n=1 Tax=Streptomyces sp. NRRL S-244 TaxID=1463897 RepID=UPI0005634947|nr:DUF5133 domain-containing protein [Streptomyces sp. NRRL S-244]